jgi:virginiamycin B lyase
VLAAGAKSRQGAGRAKYQKNQSDTRLAHTIGFVAMGYIMSSERRTGVWKMRKRCVGWLLTVVVLVGAAVGVATQAPAQTVTEFPIPTASSLPSGITVGPDGALWFTESGAGKIGRITTAGVITEFPLPTHTSQPNGITTGPDGALWFAESLGGVGRMTTAGATTEFPVFGLPYGITTGPGGELWFTSTEIHENSIGSISTAGRAGGITMGGLGIPCGITTGPDGLLWFAGCAQALPPCARSEIVRTTWDGAFTQYPAAGVSAYGITVGPDGALWFTDSGPSNHIGRKRSPGR